MPALVCMLMMSLGLGGAPFRRGDVNADGRVDIADVIEGLMWLFDGGAEPPCRDALDANDDGLLNVADPIGIAHFLFASSPMAPPVDACGSDPTGDRLSCRNFPPCTCIDPVLTHDQVRQLIRGKVEELRCYPCPVGTIDIPLIGKLVVCPTGRACSNGKTGCDVEIRTLELDLDLAGGWARLRGEGEMLDVPVELHDLLGGVSHCVANAWFAADGVLSLGTEPIAECGYRKILRAGLYDIENIEFGVEFSGGAGCAVLNAVGDLFPSIFKKSLKGRAEVLIAGHTSAITGIFVRP